MKDMKEARVDFENILYSEDGGIVTITLNRPKAYNALNTRLNKDLEEALNIIEVNPDARVLIVQGSEKVFAAGADVSELMEADPCGAYDNCGLAHRIFRRLENLRIPVIAAICGPALGGGLELALSCDFRIGGENAVFGLPEITLGIIPGAGGTQRLARLIGLSRAKEMIFLGKKIKSDQALDYGLITGKVPDAEVMGAARELAEELCKLSAPALARAKESVNFGFYSGLDSGLEFEKRNFSMAFATEDQKEGMKAFFERRKPVFTNK